MARLFAFTQHDKSGMPVPNLLKSGIPVLAPYQARPCSIYAFEFYRGLGARRRGLTCTHGYPQRAPHKQLSPRMVPTFQDRGHAQQELARPPIARPYYQARPWRNYTFDFLRQATRRAKGAQTHTRVPAVRAAQTRGARRVPKPQNRRRAQPELVPPPPPPHRAAILPSPPVHNLYVRYLRHAANQPGRGGSPACTCAPARKAHANGDPQGPHFPKPAPRTQGKLPGPKSRRHSS